jgi:hypothetical protein
MNKEKAEREKAFAHGHTLDQRLLLSIESLLKELLDELKAQRKSEPQMLLEGNNVSSATYGGGVVGVCGSVGSSNTDQS